MKLLTLTQSYCSDVDAVRGFRATQYAIIELSDYEREDLLLARAAVRKMMRSNLRGELASDLFRSLDCSSACCEFEVNDCVAAVVSDLDLSDSNVRAYAAGLESRATRYELFSHKPVKFDWQQGYCEIPEDARVPALDAASSKSDEDGLVESYPFLTWRQTLKATRNEFWFVARADPFSEAVETARIPWRVLRKGRSK